MITDRSSDLKNLRSTLLIMAFYTVRLLHYGPKPNGEVEQQNWSLLKSMRIAQAEGKDWKIELVHYLTTYRTTPHSVTRVCPAESLFGRRIRTKLPELCERAVNDEEL